MPGNQAELLNVARQVIAEVRTVITLHDQLIVRTIAAGFAKESLPLLFWLNGACVYFVYYNFCRIHSSIRCTPAMESGLTSHVWTLRELLAA